MGKVMTGAASGLEAQKKKPRGLSEPQGARAKRGEAEVVYLVQMAANWVELA